MKKNIAFVTCVTLLVSIPVAATTVENIATARAELNLGEFPAEAVDTDSTTGLSDLAVSASATITGELHAASANTAISTTSPGKLLVYQAYASVDLLRESTDPSVYGFAGAEPAQTFTFIAPEGIIRLDVDILGQIAITNEQSGNNSFVRYDVRINNQTSGQSIYDEFEFNSESGYAVIDTRTFETQAGDLISVSIDNAVTSSIDNLETLASLEASVALTFTVVPEPGSLAVLGVGVLLVFHRRRI